MTNKKGQEVFGILGGFLVTIIFLVGFFVFLGLRIVEYNEYAFENEFGTLHKDLKQTGINWIGIGTLERVNNQVRNYVITVNSASRDMQDVTIELNLNMRLKEDEAYNFIANYKKEEVYIEYLNNKVQEKVKTIILKYQANDILGNRLSISEELNNAIKDIKELNYFQLNDLAIKDIKFGEEYTKSLERKAQVDVEREIIIKQRENLEAMKDNMKVLDIDTYFKYQLIEKWDGKSPLIISDSVLYSNGGVRT